MKIDGSGFRLAGMESCGRAATFLVMTGHERIGSIVADLADARKAAAARAGASGCRCS
jgi:hypothetical protein